MRNSRDFKFYIVSVNKVLRVLIITIILVIASLLLIDHFTTPNRESQPFQPAVQTQAYAHGRNIVFDNVVKLSGSQNLARKLKMV